MSGASAGKQESGHQAHPVDGNFEALLSRIQAPELRAVARFWHDARRGRQMPSWTDITSSVPSPYSKLIWGYAYDPETGDFTGRSASAQFSKWVGGAFRGRELQDLQYSTHQEARQLLSRIVTTPLAGRSSGRLFTTGDLGVTGERIVLPLAADGKTGDAVMGASVYVPPPLLGPFEMVHENLEWYAI